MTETLEKIEIKKVVGPTPTGAAVLLGNEEKTFVVFIGFHESSALLRELKGEPAIRPLTHDLLQSVFLGFDITIKQIIITEIIESAFCATLILEQRVVEGSGEWAGRRNEVRIDARPSDCLILALKNQAEIHVTRQVLDQVQDFTELSEAEGAMVLNSPIGDPILEDSPDEFTMQLEEDFSVEDDSKPSDRSGEDEGEDDEPKRPDDEDA